jgi:8-oxo-dGTP pyrophosphatase MutT (NUDIX family)
MISITKNTLLDHFANTAKTPPLAPTKKKTNTLKPASVLVPIIDEKELLVLFTQRTSHLSHHAGQISFPGGGMETIDSDLAATALRETQEEIGLALETITLLGHLTPIISVSGFLVTPFIGLINPPLQLILNPQEVAAIFTAPLNFVLDPRNQRKELYSASGIQREVYVINYEEHRIWGMTAKILVEMTERLKL